MESRRNPPTKLRVVISDVPYAEEATAVSRARVAHSLHIWFSWPSLTIRKFISCPANSWTLADQTMPQFASTSTNPRSQLQRKKIEPAAINPRIAEDLDLMMVPLTMVSRRVQMSRNEVAANASRNSRCLTSISSVIDPCLSMTIHNDEIIAIARAVADVARLFSPLAHLAGFPETASSSPFSIDRALSMSIWPLLRSSRFPTVISSPSLPLRCTCSLPPI